MASSLEREIHEQPDVLRRLVVGQMPAVRRVVDRLRKKPPRFLVIAARGTSDNAAVYAKYAFTVYNRVPVVLAAPSIVTLYDSPPDMSESLVIGISQSGTRAGRLRRGRGRARSRARRRSRSRTTAAPRWPRPPTT